MEEDKDINILRNYILGIHLLEEQRRRDGEVDLEGPSLELQMMLMSITGKTTTKDIIDIIEDIFNNPDHILKPHKIDYSEITKQNTYYEQQKMYLQK